ncbi:MAG: hypothetical protein NTW56_02250 [Alphaproteobacteria bacterium]|jgi:hypothetical protein|nr:hypothetical protein [Alphaproteobacteria bacterium]
MAQPQQPPHDLGLFVAEGEEAEWLGSLPWRDRLGRVTEGDFYLVLHRRGGFWTHLYRVADAHGAHSFQVFLERAVAGDARGEARHWLLQQAAAWPRR